ncbi:hypothetical protein DPMN_183241 [Dreissena polymorpha]|uniref:Uncharacterized protein n=1 Tax=Dreissena polymorpha TaxID=45954 RepID=A0A9D4DH83_DREPO|nr:hypothetical protein DPMN_183241 [Dreissena polymorpha]
MQGREYQTLTARGLIESVYDRIADRDVHLSEYENLKIATETSFQSTVPPIQGATSSTDDVT